MLLRFLCSKDEHMKSTITPSAAGKFWPEAHEYSFSCLSSTMNVKKVPAEYLFCMMPSGHYFEFETYLSRQQRDF